MTSGVKPLWYEWSTRASQKLSSKDPKRSQWRAALGIQGKVPLYGGKQPYDYMFGLYPRGQGSQIQIDVFSIPQQDRLMTVGASKDIELRSGEKVDNIGKLFPSLGYKGIPQ